MNLDGLQLPARAIVRSSAADGQGYRATVEVLNGRGEPTGQTLPDLPLDRTWLGRDGAGFFAPPMPGREVLVVWSGGSAGHPVITSAGEREPHAPASSVPQGAAAWQDGMGAELRQHADGSWWWRNRAGAEVAVDVPGLWRVASTAMSLHTVLASMIAAGKAATTVTDHDTDPGGTGAELPMNGATKADWDAAQVQLDLVLRA